MHDEPSKKSLDEQVVMAGSVEAEKPAEEDVKLPKETKEVEEEEEQVTAKNAQAVATLDCYSYSREFLGLARLREINLLPYTHGPHPGPLCGIFLSGVLPRGGRGLARRRGVV